MRPYGPFLVLQHTSKGTHDTPCPSWHAVMPQCSNSMSLSLQATCAEQPADPYQAMADKCRAAAQVRWWLQGAFDEVIEAQPADPYRALAEKCQEKGVKVWMDQAFAEIVAEQPADPRKALADKCQKKSIGLWLTRTFAEVCAELQPQSAQDDSRVMAAMAERCRQKANG